MPIEIRLINKTEYKEVNDFHNKASPAARYANGGARSYSEFSWEFIDCPYGEALYVGAWEHEKGKLPLLIGTQCFIIFKMIGDDGRHYFSAKGEATLIDVKALIKYKNRDILNELFNVLIQECHRREIEFVWGFNNIPATYKRLGFEIAFKSHHGVLVLKPLKAYKHVITLKSNSRKLERLKMAIGFGLAYVYSWKKLLIDSAKNKYHTNNDLSENTTLFRNASFADKLIFLVQDKEYLRWRISQNPYAVNYKCFQLVDENHELVAQVICNIKKEVAFIEQTLFDKKTSNEIRQAFLKKITKVLQKENICLIRYTGFKNNKLNRIEMRLFKSLGFVFTGKGDWFTFKNLSADSKIHPENIYLSRIYKQGAN